MTFQALYVAATVVMIGVAYRFSELQFRGDPKSPTLYVWHWQIMVILALIVQVALAWLTWWDVKPVVVIGDVLLMPLLMAFFSLKGWENYRGLYHRWS